MNLLFDVKDLDINSKKSVFFSLLTKYNYDINSSTAYTFDNVQAYEINIFTKKIKTYSLSKPNKNNYYIEIKK